VLAHVRQNGQKFLFETGQETPVTLRRLMEDLGNRDVGINLDPANLILYGKANPVDALDVFGSYVLDVHAKDGVYPVNGRQLGEEKPLGQGKVNFPRLIARLKELGYDGAITIEREISGEEQRKDIINAIKILKELI
jgi:sugar phosphate isomerase/epimerase